LADRVAAAGEPFIGRLQPRTLHARLTELGFSKIEDLDTLELVREFLGLIAYLAVKARGVTRGGGHVLYAGTPMSG